MKRNVVDPTLEVIQAPFEDEFSQETSFATFIDFRLPGIDRLDWIRKDDIELEFVEDLEDYLEEVCY